jgi:C4-dicarboxylate-specific signal transduction histidine kinase
VDPLYSRSFDLRHVPLFVIFSVSALLISWVIATQQRAERTVRRVRDELQQVLLNLVMNGVEALSAVAERARELLIQSGIHESQSIVVAVRDAGIGLDPQTLDRIFDPFFTTKPEGMGMGL